MRLVSKSVHDCMSVDSPAISSTELVAASINPPWKFVKIVPMI